MAAPSAVLSIVQRACDEMNLARPTGVVTANDPQVRQLLALLHQEGRYLMKGGLKKHNWSFLRTLYTFPTVDGTATYAVPSDFDRMIDDTFWDQTNDRKVAGPDTPQVDRWRQQSISGPVGIYKNFRVLGSNVQLFPTPDAVATMGYEYISNKWVRSAASAAQTEFLADTDTSLFDPYLMILGLKWRFLAGKGLGAMAAKIEYDDYYESCVAGDSAGETLRLDGSGMGTQFLSLDNVPDTGHAV
jgi:hypothetical protein